ncbi:MAG TPA: universal stress protein [Burkholderiaceae bacterium]|nr:universal stress protein [Burkholderiaceae bacterium]
MYEKILVPLDGSPTSELGLAEAIKLARLTGARLALLHVVDTAAVAIVPEAAAGAASVFDVMRASGEQILAKARLDTERAGVAVETALLETVAGRVSDLVVEEASKRRADLIVMGTHGRRGVGRMLLGSDAELVVRNARVPVLLVRAREHA